jgi:hypothetical protein
MRPVYVSVCGGSTASDVEAAKAQETGRLLALAGAVLVTGGLGGVMAAASKGANEAGGIVLGLLPGDRHEAANPFCTAVVPTGFGEARNVLVVRAADAVIAIGGEWGTLSEIALAMKTGKPVVAIDSWDPVKDGRPAPGIRRARMPEEAVRMAVSAAKEHRAANR